MPGQSGSFRNLPNTYQRNSQSSGGLSGPRQQSDGLPPVRQQPGGLTTPAQSGIPRTVRPTPMTPAPPQGSSYGSANLPSSTNGTFAKPAIEKITSRGVPQA